MPKRAAKAMPKQDSRETESMRQELRRLVSDLKATPFFDGELKTVTLAADSNVVSHSLGRAPEGAFITVPKGQATSVYFTTSNDATLTLVSSAAVTAQVWIF